MDGNTNGLNGQMPGYARANTQQLISECLVAERAEKPGHFAPA